MHANPQGLSTSVRHPAATPTHALDPLLAGQGDSSPSESLASCQNAELQIGTRALDERDPHLQKASSIGRSVEPAEHTCTRARLDIDRSARQGDLHFVKALDRLEAG